MDVERIRADALAHGARLRVLGRRDRRCRRCCARCGSSRSRRTPCIDPDEQAILAADLPAFTTQTQPPGGGDGRAPRAWCSTAPAERIVLIDEQAREIPPDTTLHLLIGLVAKHHAGEGRIVIPANVSRVAERIAGAYDVPVERAGITQAGLIAAAAAGGRDLRGLARRGLRLPRVPARLRRDHEHRRGARAAGARAQAAVRAARRGADVGPDPPPRARAVEPQGARDARAERARHRDCATTRPTASASRRTAAGRSSSRIPTSRCSTSTPRARPTTSPRSSRALPLPAGRGAGHRRPVSDADRRTTPNAAPGVGSSRSPSTSD